MTNLDQEFAEIVKERNNMQKEKDNLFTVLFIVAIVLPLWLLVGRKF